MEELHPFLLLFCELRPLPGAENIGARLNVNTFVVE